MFQKGYIPWNKGKKCSQFSGENNSQWKGGRRMHSRGYVWLYNPEHPYKTKQGYIFEHRLVMEKMLGRYLKPEEVMHHINGILDDNRKENLMLFNNQKEHLSFHKKEREV